MSSRFLLITCFLCILVSSCGLFGGSNTTISKATGSKIEQAKPKPREVAPGLVFIEGGAFDMGAVQDDVMYDWNNTPKKVHVQSFFMDETEATNAMYLEYLRWLKKIFPPSDANVGNVYKSAVPDTMVWRNSLGFNEDMVTNYLRHPAFAEYPVVGVSWIQAADFAKWRTNRVNEQILIKEGYLSKNADEAFSEEARATFDTETYLTAPKSSFGGLIDSLQGKKKKDTVSVYATVDTGMVLPAYRLPTEAEWEYAAGAFKGERVYNNIGGKKKYPWGSNYTRAKKYSRLGMQLANFKNSKGDYGGLAGWTDDGGDITVKVKSYPPNGFGLYDMAGNVSEWVADVYRPIVDDNVSDFNYFRGNVYLEPKIGEGGKYQMTTMATMVYDTLQNGKLHPVSLPGEMEKKPLDIKDTSIRSNFSASDNIDFADGDKLSRKDFATETAATPGKESRMYNAPINKVKIDSLGNTSLIPDKSGRRTTLIDNSIRVYKGGSWRDRTYWLDPAQRRFLPQYLASDDIGFRCAMSRVGDRSIKGRTKKDARKLDY